jgi:hypothetical protein
VHPEQLKVDFVVTLAPLRGDPHPGRGCLSISISSNRGAEVFLPAARAPFRVPRHGRRPIDIREAGLFLAGRQTRELRFDGVEIVLDSREVGSRLIRGLQC